MLAIHILKIDYSRVLRYPILDKLSDTSREEPHQSISYYIDECYTDKGNQNRYIQLDNEIINYNLLTNN